MKLTAKEIKRIEGKVQNMSDAFFSARGRGDTNSETIYHQYILGMVSVLDVLGYEVTYNGQKATIMEVIGGNK